MKTPGLCRNVGRYLAHSTPVCVAGEMLLEYRYRVSIAPLAASNQQQERQSTLLTLVASATDCFYQ
jgi:hypothetical protein